MTPLLKALHERLPQFSLEDIAAVLPAVQRGRGALPLPEIEAGVRAALARVVRQPPAQTPLPATEKPRDYRGRVNALARRAAASTARLDHERAMNAKYPDWHRAREFDWYEREDRALRKLLEYIRECELPCEP